MEENRTTVFTILKEIFMIILTTVVWGLIALAVGFMMLFLSAGIVLQLIQWLA